MAFIMSESTESAESNEACESHDALSDALAAEHRLIAQRRAKLQALRAVGQAFPNDFRRSVYAQRLHECYGAVDNAVLEATPIRVAVAGRIMAKRIMGKASFVQIKDSSATIQLFLQRDSLADGVYEAFKSWDIGDIIGAEGFVFRTKTGELSVRVEQLRLLTKSLRPLPEKFHGLTDQELRYRQRYVDLIVNDQTRRLFELRSRVIRYLRHFFDARDFLEVETPMMHPIPGGATARPFKTYHNALEMDLFLRIAPELYLKRLVVGGLERVYEINRNFRNEGLSTRHNPEFTMIEFYMAYADYRDLMDMLETLLRELIKDLFGQTHITYQGESYEFGQAFERLTLREAVVRHNPALSSQDLANRCALQRYATQLGIEIKEEMGIGKIQLEIFEKTVEQQLKNPTFITQYPTEVSPLARCNDHDPSITDRFELFIGGREIANGFSELNDPEDQAERFRKQVEQKASGDEEAMLYDADYIRALEYGMPPTAGAGIGIDRLVMLLTDSPSIRDVLLFPHLRSQET